MTRLRNLILAAAAIAAALILPPAPQAEAAQINVCAPTASGTSPGPRRWTAAGSGTTYGLNNAGCVLLSPVDLADALSDGFVLRSQLFSAVAYRFTAATSIVIPGGTYIDRIIVQETSNAAITGGLKIGTTNGGTEISASITCAALCLSWVPDVSITTSARIFANTGPKTIFMGAVTNFNSGPEVTVTVVYGYW